MIVTGLIHDLGKVLCLWGEPQWAVVGDTFPVGCAFSDKIVYPEFFEENADRHDPRTRPSAGSTSATAVSSTSTCRGATTSTCITR